MQASLYVRRGPQSGAVFPLYGTAITLIGRAASNHVVLRDATVSTNHCLIAPSREAEGFVLLDAHGRTELEVNGRPFTKGHITLGDVLTVGAFELELVSADRPWPAPEPLRPTSGGPARFEFGRARRRTFLPLPPGSATVVGRGPFAHIRVDHALISEYHCLIALDPDNPSAMPVLIDLHSANGTHVHGRGIHRKHILPRDPLLLGRTAFELRRIDVPQAPPAPRRKRVAPLKRRLVAADAPPPARRAPAPAEPAPRPAVQAPAASARAGLGEQLAFLAGAPTGRQVVPLVPLPPAGPTPEPLPSPAIAPPPTSLELLPASESTAQAIAEETPPPGLLVPLDSTQVVAPLPSPEPTLLTGRSATARALARKPDGFLEWFDFHDDPFVHTADPRYFYHSPCHWEAFTTLNRWIETGPPLAVLFGEHGSGKTFVTSCLARRLALISPRTVLVRPDREAARRNDLILEAVLAASAKVGGPALGGSTPIEVWHALLTKVRRNRALFVFLIDDAHELSRDNLRRLTELLETPGLRDSARILLAGEEQLRDLVAVPPLADHLGVTCYLAPMPADDVAAYVLHRVGLASDEDRPLFTRRALEMLATYSGGIPRLINNVADAALCHAYRRDAHEVTPDLLAAALDELLHADTA